MISFSEVYCDICQSLSDQVKQELSFSRVSSVKDKWHRTVLVQIQITLGAVSAAHTHSVQILADEVETILRRQFGNNHELILSGSLTKSTYVAGLSDIDLLFVPDDPEMARKSPGQIQKCLFRALPESSLNLHVEIDENAVAVMKSDVIIQIVPALRETQGIRFPTPDGSGWIKVNPSLFTNKLAKHNDFLKGKLVSAIRLAKLMLSRLPRDSRLNGYHLEVLACSTCERYAGDLSLTTILLHFLKCAAHTVLQPLPDVTGQTHFVDGYLGPPSSVARKVASASIASVWKTLASEKEVNSLKSWKALLEVPRSLSARPSLPGN